MIRDYLFWTLTSHLVLFILLIFKPNIFFLIHNPHFKVYIHLKRNMRTLEMFLRQSTKILVSESTTCVHLIKLGPMPPSGGRLRLDRRARIQFRAGSYQGKAYRHKSPCCSFSFLSPVLCRWSYFHRIVPYCIPLFCFASKEIYSAMVNILSLHTIQSVYSNILKNMDKK